MTAFLFPGQGSQAPGMGADSGIPAPPPGIFLTALLP